MSEFIPQESPCSSCVGACCRKEGSVIMPLYEDEVENMASAGTEFKIYLEAGKRARWSNVIYRTRNISLDNRQDQKLAKKLARHLEPGQGLYMLASNCGFLEETAEGYSVCGVHGDPDLQPRVCRDFPPGSKTCTRIRDRVMSKLEEESGWDVHASCPELDLAQIAMGEKTLETTAI